MITGPLKIADMKDQRTLDIGVIGSGIAGLAAGIALCRAGHKVTIYERSHFKQEIGAAITFCPNANRILDSWGFDRKAAGSTAKQGVRRMKWDSLEVLYQHKYENIAEKYGSEFDAFHRVDVHQALRVLAEENGAEILLGKQATKLDCQEGIITFKDGEEVQKEVVVVADGIRSQFVSTVTGGDDPIIQTRGSVFRTLVPIDRLHSYESFRTWIEGHPTGFFMATGHPNMQMTAYPCRDDKLMNVAIFHPTRKHLEQAQGWSYPATKEDVFEVLQGWPEIWHDLIKAADDDAIKVYRVEQRDTIPTLVNDRAALIGDAAHGMLPTYAQGGAMGVEDAAALGVLLSNLKPDDDNDVVKHRLKLWNDLRWPRCFTVQYLANKRNVVLAKGGNAAAKADPQFCSFYKGPELPPLELDPFGEVWGDFFWNYDVRIEAEKALQDGNLDRVRYFDPAQASQSYGAESVKSNEGARTGEEWF